MDVLTEFNNQNVKYVDAFSYDLENAFLGLSHNYILNELASLNIDPKFIKLIANDMSNQTQVIKINDIVSDPIIASSGVKQGGVKSPLIFNIAIKDILDSVKYCKNIVKYINSRMTYLIQLEYQIMRI